MEEQTKTKDQLPSNQSEKEEASSSNNNNSYVRPKNKKELRAEKKAALKIMKKQQEKQNQLQVVSKEEKRSILQKERKQKQKELKKEQRIQMLKEEREFKKIHKLKKRHREENAKGGNNKNKKVKQNNAQVSSSSTTTTTTTGGGASSTQDIDSSIDMNVYNNLFNGEHDEITGLTTLQMGIQYKDILKKGKKSKKGGSLGLEYVKDGSLVNVSYKLQGYKTNSNNGSSSGAIIDSSNNFTFRVGKNEVIKGWDLGILGMREGGRRQLIVPREYDYFLEYIIIYYIVSILCILTTDIPSFFLLTFL